MRLITPHPSVRDCTDSDTMQFHPSYQTERRGGRLCRGRRDDDDVGGSDAIEDMMLYLHTIFTDVSIAAIAKI